MTLDPLKLSQDLMCADSVTPDDGRGLKVIADVLRPMGFACHDLVFEEEGYDTVHNLYARIGEGSPNFCFAGHTDVVPPGNLAAWRYDPFASQVHEGKLYGRGAEDMKTAIAAFVVAAERFLGKHGGTPPKGSLSFMLTGDEEGPGVNGTPKMLDWARHQGEALDVCLVGEPTNPTYLGEMAKIGRRGSVICELTINGKQGHVAYPDQADNPVTKLVEILHQLKTTKLDEGTVYFPPSNLEVTTMDVGNKAVNVIPESAFARFNIRFNDQHHSSDLIKWIHGVCKQVHEDYVLETRVSGEAFLTPPGE
ncbi:MAG: succinyl-diaminopimelate desuccinylase, partial [Rickettsiales bacterium]